MEKSKEEILESVVKQRGGRQITIDDALKAIQQYADQQTSLSSEEINRLKEELRVANELLLPGEMLGALKMQQQISQLQSELESRKEKGMRWVKASEKLPVKRGECVVRVTGGENLENKIICMGWVHSDIDQIDATRGKVTLSIPVTPFLKLNGLTNHPP